MCNIFKKMNTFITYFVFKLILITLCGLLMKKKFPFISTSLDKKKKLFSKEHISGPHKIIIIILYFLGIFIFNFYIK